MNSTILFAIATVINVTLSTIRSLCTIKGGKWVSAITNALCYGFYPLIVMLTAKDTVSIIVNMIITALANFVCVWLIKFIEEKSRKDKLWKVEATVKTTKVYEDLIENGISCNCLHIANGGYIVNCFCPTQKDSLKAKEILKQYNAKYFVSESKTL